MFSQLIDCLLIIPLVLLISYLFQFHPILLLFWFILTYIADLLRFNFIELKFLIANCCFSKAESLFGSWGMGFEMNYGVRRIVIDEFLHSYLSELILSLFLIYSVFRQFLTFIQFLDFQWFNLINSFDAPMLRFILSNFDLFRHSK